ncbi:MAG: alkyl sulfatase dimerization domain-containing protein [Tepidiformaceae bacterium]
MPTLREYADQIWNGEIDTVNVAHPIRGTWLTAEEVMDGVLYYKGIASANTLDTGDGLVMLDTGATQDSAPLFEQVRRWRPDARLASAVFSHHHVDHIFGVGPFEAESEVRGWARPLVYGHEHLGRNFDRYKKTLGWNTAINKRQFAIAAPQYRFGEPSRYPDVTYSNSLTLRQGELTFELRHTRGETEDATWTWVPEKKILAPGDLFIYATPNAGNPQKVQRYVGEWAAGLREMAALGAELMLPGHGFPIFGSERIRMALTDTAELLESIEGQVLALMNTGASLDTVLHSVAAPPTLLEKPYLRVVYDHPEFLVRNIWRLYGGWHDGEPDNLLPAPRLQQAREWVALAGGIERVLDRAGALRVEGDLRMACHLLELAVIAEPGSKAAHALRAEVYAARAALETSSMSRNLLNHAALSSQQEKRDIAGGW